MLTQDRIDRIRRLKGDGFPVLSVYINLGPDIRETRSIRARLMDMLHPIKEAVGSLEHAAATSLRTDIEHVLGLQPRLQGDIGHGIAMFTCNGRGFFEYVTFPRRVWDKAVADATPYIRPLVAVLDEFHRYCAVVVDRRRAEIFEYYMGDLGVHESSVREGLRTSHFEGWYGLAEHGVRRRAEESWHRHYRETAKVVEEAFASRGFELLLLGGHREAVQEFEPFLSRRLKQRIGGRFILDPHTMTPATIREHCTRLEDEFERREEEALVQGLLETWHRAGPAVIGLEHVLDAANARAISHLVVSDGTVAPGVVCDRCGWLGVDRERCLLCDTETRSTTDVIDELTEITIDEGGLVEHVFAHTPLETHKLGALLRSPLAGSTMPSRPQVQVRLRQEVSAQPGSADHSVDGG